MGKKKLKESDFQEKFFKLGTLFKPSTPINRVDLFAGRMSQRADVVDAINQSGQHIALYGEPGVGKTSLANMLFPALTSTGSPVITPLINCVHQDEYTSIWKRLFEQIQIETSKLNVEIPEDLQPILADYTQPYADSISPDVVCRVLSLLGTEMIVVAIIDEFNTLASADARHMMSDTIKYLSDRNVPATVVVIGVADDVQSLVANHQSIERCLVQVRMPRMFHSETESLIKNILKLMDMEIDADALNDICRLSKGLPHFAHLLGLHSGRESLSQLSLCVKRQNVLDAVSRALARTQASIQSTYRQAIASNRKNAKYREVLLACAFTQTDEFGYFTAKDVCRPLTHILRKSATVEGFSRHLHAFADTNRGAVLKKEVIGKGNPTYRFSNPLLQPYVMLKGLADKLISKHDLTNDALLGKDLNRTTTAQFRLFER